MPKSYRIGELAQAADIPVETIRYYEGAGLMPAPQRSGANYRLYQEAHRERLTFIRQCRALDMTLDEIRRLLTFKDSAPQDCAEVGSLLDEHIGHISERMRELAHLKKDLKALRQQCNAVEKNSECGILGQLSAGTATRHVRREGPIARDRRRHRHEHK